MKYDQSRKICCLIVQLIVLIQKYLPQLTKIKYLKESNEL